MKLKEKMSSVLTHKIKLLPVAVGMLLPTLPTLVSNATDLEIYSPSTTGGATLTLMLDTSGSMENFDGNRKCRTVYRYLSQKDSSGNIITNAAKEVYTVYSNGTYTVDYQPVGTYTNDSKFYTVVKKDDGTDGEKVPLNLRGCGYINSSDPWKDRLTRMKDALVPLLADPVSGGLGTDYATSKKIGFGSFIELPESDGDYGAKINYPAKPLTYENRLAMAKQVAGLSANTSTPSGLAYAEAGAYMMGSSTMDANATENLYTVGKIVRFKNGGRPYYQFYECTAGHTITSGTNYYFTKRAIPCRAYLTDIGYEWESNFTNSIDLSSLSSIQSAKDRNNVRGYVSYDFDEIDYNAGRNAEEVILFKRRKEAFMDRFSGFSESNDLTKVKVDGKVGDKYQSPIPDSTAECDGYGIYFLTDGEPNRGRPTSWAMSNSLLNAGSTTTIGKYQSRTGGVAGNSVAQFSDCVGLGDTNMTDRGAVYATSAFGGEGSPAWECMAAYAKVMNSTTNPKGTAVKTATVGFGDTFNSLAGKKVEKEVTLANGKKVKEDVYDCSQATSVDAQNLCKLGEKGEGYGEGGFDYVSQSSELAESITSFIGDLAVDSADNIATGVMSIPFDQLNSQKSRGYAYLPILEAEAGSTNVWKGNLKKYYLHKGALVGANSTAGTTKNIFKNSSGIFATDTYDLWNTDETVDSGSPQVGGSYMQVLENQDNLDNDVPRNVFVNKGNTLVGGLQVTGNGPYKPIGFDGLGTEAAATAPLNLEKRQLLNFMGFSNILSSLVPTDNSDFTATFTPKKEMGGVLHSVPQLVTTSISYKDGAFDNDSRKDNVLYGSMDGALHYIDDKTGKELFTFVPKEVLELQPKAISGGSANDGSYPYGVDAPWLTYADYKLSVGSTETKYTATSISAMGGLRMGGSTYYGLDITDSSSPSLNYSVGSNYAKTLQDSSVTLDGFKNGSSFNNPISGVSVTDRESKAYARMGQTWAKPSIGTVKKGSDHILVNFLAGGYDVNYENASFDPDKPRDPADSTSVKPAQGNAVYMVNASTGELLWWASNSGSDTDAADMTHSIVSEIRPVDADYDGLTDHIYFADLGGQVWRADIANWDADEKVNPFYAIKRSAKSFNVDRVVKLFDAGDRAANSTTDVDGNVISAAETAPRFYERPLLTFDRIKYAGEGGRAGIAALITVGSGNRSLPVSDKRALDTSDALYTFIDKDITRSDLFCYDSSGSCSPSSKTLSLTTKDLTTASLTEMTFSEDDADIKANMIAKTSQGWYLPFNSWIDKDGNEETNKEKLKGIKMLNEPDAIAGLLYVGTYNPNIGNTSANSCSAGIIGSTKVERLCLPYGNCANSLSDKVKNDKDELVDRVKDYSTRVTQDIGTGIVDNILTETSTDITKLLGGSTDVDDKTLVGIACMSGECPGKELCPPGETDGCYTLEEQDFLDTNVDQVLNPLQWMER